MTEQYNVDRADSVRLAGIVEDSIVDGPGLRLAFYAQGCPHKCPGCHNPQAHPFEGGSVWTTEDMLKKLDDNPLQTGVTLSGGEPFSQAAQLALFAEACKARAVEVAVYTGYTYEELLEQAVTDAGFLALLQQTDVLVDGRFVLSLRSPMLRFRGSSNQRIIDVPASLAIGTVQLMTESRWTGD